METIVLESIQQTTEELAQKAISTATSYLKYRELVDSLALEGKSTGPEQTEILANYTFLNSKRMKRLDKTLKIDDESARKIKGFDKEITFLLITESWCGDAAQILPVINKVAELNDKIALKVILRDENLDVMNRFLTNNAMSIPKLIMIDDTTGQIIGEWGPRPIVANQMVVDYKNKYGGLTPEFKEELQLWYNKDKGQNIVNELLELLFLE